MTAVVLTVGCGGEGADPRETATTAEARDRPAARAKLLATGRRIFDKQCSFCHRLNGNAPTAHAGARRLRLQLRRDRDLAGVRHRAGDEGVRRDAVLSRRTRPRQIRAVAMYVIANQGSDVDASAPPQERLTAGGQVFAERCQRCHSIAGRPLTGKPGKRGCLGRDRLPRRQAERPIHEERARRHRQHIHARTDAGGAGQAHGARSTTSRCTSRRSRRPVSRPAADAQTATPGRRTIWDRQTAGRLAPRRRGSAGESRGSL